MALLETVIGGIGSIVGGLFGDSSAEKAAEKQAQLQREFAKNGIRWRVEDAQKAGIHPLYALGANTTSYSPVSVGGSDWGSIAGNMGANIGRAMDVGRSADEKSSAFEKTVQDLTLQKMGLENDLLASQLRIVNQPGHPPGINYGGSNSDLPDVIRSGGSEFVRVDRTNTPAQVAEDQYGEIGGEVVGLPNLLEDLRKTYLPNSKLPSEVINDLETGIYRWLMETGNQIYATPRRKYQPYQARPSGARKYTFVP